MSKKHNSIGEGLGSSPSRISSPELRFEAQKAFIWTAIIGVTVLAIYISQSLLIIFGAMVAASLIDGGSRILGRFLPISRTLRVTLVLLATVGFFYWLIVFAGAQISQEAAQFPAIIQQQSALAFEWVRDQGFTIETPDFQDLAANIMSGVGTVTRAIGGIVGGFTTLLLISIIGFVLMLVLVGFLIIFLWLLWLIVRIVTGYQLAQANQPITGVELLGMKAI